MHQSDPNSPAYYHQQAPHFQPPIPQTTPTDPHPYGASAPPVHDYSSGYPHYSDHTPNLHPYTDPVPSPYPYPQPSDPYSFPHLNSHSYNQPPVNYDYAPAPKPVTPNQDPVNYDYTAPNPANYDYTPTHKANPGFGGYGDQGLYGDGVYAYSGGSKEPYGARGSGSSRVAFDDYGRPIGAADVERRNGSGSKVVKAVPKAEVDDDMAGGVQKFRARLLSEGAGQSDMDVLCQIGLDGIRILDPATSRTLRIYPLETVTRYEVLDSYLFAFWAKTSIDMEPKRIRLKSNSYTSNNMLDTVTAASFQLKEIGETKKPADAIKVSEQASEKKKGFPDWMNLMKPRNEEKDYWVPDEAVNKCTSCGTDFNAFVRRHHCRNCGDIFCDKCTQGRIALTADENDVPVRVCDRCMAEVTQRLTNVKEDFGKVASSQSHADLAKKLKEEMDKNRKPSTGHNSIGAGTRMKDVACPTCTVHLQVQAPSSGSETIECSVCQHPFLVHA